MCVYGVRLGGLLRGGVSGCDSACQRLYTRADVGVGGFVGVCVGLGILYPNTLPFRMDPLIFHQANLYTFLLCVCVRTCVVSLGVCK